MKIVCDGGGCCGIKTIRDIQYVHPEYGAETPALSNGHDYDSTTTDPEELFSRPWQTFTSADAAVQRTNEEMFEFLLNQIKERRPAGMVIVNLAVDSYCLQWEPILLKHGFEYVELFNSNSCNKVRQFRLVYNMGVCTGCGDLDDDCCCDDY